MQIAPADDGWHPLPGSWEEAVDPYDVQRLRYRTRRKAKTTTHAAPPGDDPHRPRAAAL